MSTDNIIKGLMEWKDPAQTNSIKHKKINEYLEWIEDACYGDQYIYHKGISPTESFIASLLARKVYKDYEKGLVYPISVRKAPFIFDFIAIRSSKKA